MPKPPQVFFTFDEENEVASITVNGYGYLFRYDFEAIQTFFLTRKFIPDGSMMGLDPNNWSTLLWVGLLHGEPQLKLETVISWFNSVTIVPLYEGTWKAWTLGQPQKAKEAQETSENPPIA